MTCQSCQNERIAIQKLDTGDCLYVWYECLRCGRHYVERVSPRSRAALSVRQALKETARW